MIYSLRLKSHLKNLLLLSSLIIITGCAFNRSLYRQEKIFYAPEQIKTESRKNGVNFTVRTNFWYGSPKNLNRYVTAVYISVENNSDAPVIIEREDIVLLDNLRNQYNALSPDDVANILLSSERSGYTRIYPSISLGIGGYYKHGNYYYGHGYYPFYRNYWFYDDYPYYDYPRAYYRPDYKQIYTEAFQPGKVMPGARLSGFAYFKKLAENRGEITLQVAFKNQDTNKLQLLDFNFKVVRTR